MASDIGSDMAMAGGRIPVVPTPAAGIELRAGDRLEARVLQILAGGQALIEFGQTQVSASTSTPLQPGARVMLEVVAGGPKPEFRIVPESAPSSPQPAAGQRFEARVLEILPSGEAVVEFGQSHATVRTTTPLQPGERVVLEVVTGGVKPEIRIVPDAPAAAPQPGARPGPEPSLSAHDLPVILRAMTQALAGGVPTANAGGVPLANPGGVPLANAGQEFLSAATASALRPAVIAQIERLLAPLEAGAPPAVLAGTIRTFLAQSGLFTENQLDSALKNAAVTVDQPRAAFDLRTLLAALTSDGKPESQADGAPKNPAGALKNAAPTPDQPRAAIDLRTLLATLPSDGRAETQNDQTLKNEIRPPASDQPRAAFDLRMLLGALTTEGKPVPDAVRAFGDALLQQQLVVAERLAATGVGHVVVPFVFGEKPVDVVVEWERQRGDDKQETPDGTISLGVFVRLPSLGAIEARLEWLAESLNVNFFVEREETRSLVQASLDDFSKELSQSGVSAVSSHVWLNPERVSKGPPPDKRPSSGGTILDVTA
jgi:hypothetical protein